MASISIGSGNHDPNAPIFLGNPSGISAFADQQTDAANTFLLRLAEATEGVVPPTIEPVFPTGGSAPALEVPVAPARRQAVWVAPNAPSAFTGSLTIDDILPEPFDEAPPVLAFGTAPDAFNATLPDAPSVDLSYVEPELTVELPAVPSLLSINVRQFDGLNLPTFDADEPVLDLVEPTIREYVPGAAYTSALLTTLKTSLQSWIEDGGTGLNPDVENAIWDRGREREAKTRQEAIDRLEQSEELGFMMPPGFYADARLKILTESAEAERGHGREVMIKAAELEQENLKVALQAAMQLESKLIDNANAVEQRLFEATRYATEAGVQIYNAKVQGFAALVDVYRAKVGAYEALVRAETAKVEAYRAEVQAEEAKAQVNRALVDQYQAQAEVALSSIRIFEARINGIRAKAEIERSKVEIFGEQVRAYGAQVNAYTAGVEGYRASLQAEETKQRVYASAVDAYSARVGAARTVVEARVAELQGNISVHEAAIGRYRAEIEGETARIRSIVEDNNAAVETFRAEVQGAASFNEVLTKQWQAVLDQNQRTADIAVNAAKANAELYVTTRSLALDAAKVGAQVSAQLGAAAINAINWSTSISNSQSWGISTSYSNAVSESTSNSVSENTNYNYSASV